MCPKLYSGGKGTRNDFKNDSVVNTSKIIECIQRILDSKAQIIKQVGKETWIRDFSDVSTYLTIAASVAMQSRINDLGLIIHLITNLVCETSSETFK